MTVIIFIDIIFLTILLYYCILVTFYVMFLKNTLIKLKQFHGSQSHSNKSFSHCNPLLDCWTWTWNVGMIDCSLF